MLFLDQCSHSHTHVYIPAVAITTAARPVCQTCGAIKKSGKSSCCGRGGSWFKNCGSAGNAKLRHTWYEGIQVCETRDQSQRASGRQSNAARQPNSSNGIDTVNSKAVMMTAKTLTSVNPSTNNSVEARKNIHFSFFVIFLVMKM